MPEYIVENGVELIIENGAEWGTLLVAIFGAIFGLLQWRKTNDYKRAELVKTLINQVRDDKEIAAIMDFVDWGEGFTYNGSFHFTDSSHGCNLKNEQQLFVAIDRTLSHFNYICYLSKIRAFKREDIAVFDYEIRRIFDNKHICNYLHSLNMWSDKIGVNCSFKYLITYGKKKKYASSSLGREAGKGYTCFLEV